MLHMLLLILKIIGILVLCVLGLILLVAALVLLVPVRYRFYAEKRPGMKMDSILAEGKVSWLLGIFTFHGCYDHTHTKMDIRIFGHSLLHRKKREQPVKALPDSKKEKPIKALSESKEERSVKALPDSKAEKPVKEPEDTEKEQPVKASANPEEKQRKALPEPEEVSEAASKTEKARASIFAKFCGILKQLRQKISGVGEKIRNIQRKKEHLKETLQIWIDFWNKSFTQAAKDHILKDMKYLLKHILPRKMQGMLTIGFEDPATTGQVLGILCVLAVFTGNHLEVNGNFERAVLEGSVELKGHIRLCHIVKTALGLLTDKNIRKTIREFRSLTA